ncbi:predicted protein [Aspergillus nidulans FGSC A4]|uniref:Uncharacterized protein n=1 Tax=Emericella nidulans (strain FGSC A4 / ATCC 38163 / CBS 112.46 / NRRL 194 / M139) TaxID=227321 RepID=Q5AXF7_EMENI|nr:hypothetical protein [Aspergillus nidulans FGSC A4]EAA61669.1 predicted protein [Aspergillus nidulans FGSC A4]CBF79240.1 TPA: conserved hypothetical protein [Aspergillus nidulans FGSC A4]|eukprot:XP_664627.1 predicted protein [Aspergillus nidulans FGSC A4]
MARNGVMQRDPWPNVLDEVTKTRDLVVKGKHFSLSTVLDKSQEWLKAHGGQFDFVDSDNGHMGIAAKECGVRYGYLHIISDNLAKKYAYELSNERLQKVQMGRKRLIREMKEVLVEFFIILHRELSALSLYNYS